MKFCKECGNQLKEGADFCPECGSAVHKETTQVKQNEDGSQKPTRKANKEKKPITKKPITKKQKVIAISGLSAVLVLIAAFVTLSMINSPERAVNGITESIEAQDIEAVADQIYIEEEERKLTTEEAKVYIGYFENNTEKFEQLKEDLAKQAELMEDKDVVSEYDSLEDAFADHGLNDELSIKHTDGALLDKTEFVLTPSYLSISTNLPDSELADENGEKLFTFTEDETVYTVGPLVRGEYSFVVTHTGEWVDLTEVLGVEVSQPEQEISAEFDVDYVTFVGGFDEEDATQKLVINGQEIENPPLNEEIGPLQLNEQSTYEYIAELPWGEMTTGEQPLDETEIELELVNNQELADELSDALVVFYDTVLESFLEDDTNLMNIVHSDLRNYHAERIDSLHKNLETWDTGYSALHFGDYQVSDSISEVKLDWTGTWRLSLPVVEEYMFLGTEKKMDISEDDYDTNVWMYEFFYEEGEWKLDTYIPTGLMVDTENYFTYSYEGEIAELESLEDESEEEEEEEEEQSESETAENNSSDSGSLEDPAFIHLYHEAEVNYADDLSGIETTEVKVPQFGIEQLDHILYEKYVSPYEDYATDKSNWTPTEDRSAISHIENMMLDEYHQHDKYVSVGVTNYMTHGLAPDVYISVTNYDLDKDKEVTVEEVLAEKDISRDRLIELLLEKIESGEYNVSVYDDYQERISTNSDSFEEAYVTEEGLIVIVNNYIIGPKNQVAPRILIQWDEF